MSNAKTKRREPGQRRSAAPPAQRATGLPGGGSVSKNPKNAAATTKPKTANWRMVRQSFLMTNEHLSERPFSLRISVSSASLRYPFPSLLSPLATSPHRSDSRTVIPSAARNLSFSLCALCVLRVLCVNSFSSFELSTFNFQPLYLRFSILCGLCVKLLLPRRRRFPRFFAVALRHSLVIRCRLFQQFLSRFHLRSRRVLCRLVSLCPRLAFARHSPLVTRHFPRRRKSLIAPQRLPCQRLELLQARQLLQVAQSKPHQKFLRCLVQNRPPHHFFAPRRGNQVLVQERADHSRSIHSANLRNFRRSHRLLVRNHRQSLQRRHRKPQRRPQTLDKPPHHVMLLRLGEQFVPASYPANLDPARFGSITCHQLVQRSLHRQLLFPEGLRQLLNRSRLIRRINDPFQRRFSLFVSHRQGLQFRFVGLRLRFDFGRSSLTAWPPRPVAFGLPFQEPVFSGARVTHCRIVIARLTANSAIPLRALAYLPAQLP